MPKETEIRKRVTFYKDTYKQLSDIAQETGVSEGEIIRCALFVLDELGSHVLADQIMITAKNRAAKLRPKGK